MSIQVLQRGPGLGASLGEALGGGLQKGLDQLAQQKLEDMQGERLARGLAPLFPGKSPEELKGLASLALKSPQLAAQYYKQQAEEPRRKAYEEEVARIEGLKKEGKTSLEEPESLREARRGLLKPQERMQIAEFERKQKKDELDIQKAAEKYNEPYRKSLQESEKIYKPIKSLTTEILELLDAPDLQWGSIKSLTPSRFQNAQTQALVSKLEQLVIRTATIGKGVPSQARLKMEKLSKADTWQQPATIKYLVNSIDKFASEQLEPGNIARHIIKSKGKEPKYLEIEVKQKQTLNKLNKQNPASSYSPDTIIEVDGDEYKIEDDKWVPV